MQVVSKGRVLGQALLFVLGVPVLLFAMFIGAMKWFGGDNQRPITGVLFFTLCAVSQIVALSKLRERHGWTSWWVKVARYMVCLVAFILLVEFGVWAILVGYYLVHPNAPALFGGT